MEYYAIFIPDKKTDFSIKSFYNDKAEALAVLKQHKEARMKSFSSSDEAVSFYLNGPSETFSKTGTPTMSSPMKPPKSLFVAPTSQKLVAFRKLIEANNVSEVSVTIQNPRYLVSSGDTPTILKEGPRYNALHIAAIEGRSEICRLILQTIENSAYIEKLHGQRTQCTDEVSAILLDLYLNVPDKCRSETPLHFAAKHGSVDVVKELIAYPQCQVVPNADGLYPSAIICSRAKPHNATPEVREAIRVLLEERFYVPLVRFEDNLIPPTIGKPFSPTRPSTFDQPSSPTISPRGEVKAYAGPMDRNRADSFYRRWKTPPRLLVVRSQLMQVRSEEPRQVHSSTPIKAGRKPRRLFANRSLDHALLEDAARCLESGQENNNIDESREELCDSDESDAMVESFSLMDPIKEEQMQDTNGNHLSSVAFTPIRLFHQYRSLANDMDSSYDSDASCSEVNFSYLCDETRTVYDRSRLRETPTHKERSLRLSNIDKGLETLGRMLATNEKVGWKEHWAFLGKFCDLASVDGLQLFEQFLDERQHATNPQHETELALIKPMHDIHNKDTIISSPAGIKFLCDDMQRFTIRELGATVAALNDEVPYELRGPSSQSQLSNPYLCVTSSLKVFATRFLMNLQNKNLPKRKHGAHDNSFLHIVQRMDTMVDNFRADAEFREIDFDKAHTLFAFLVLALMDDRTVRKESLFAPLYSNEEGHAQPAVVCSFECIKQLLISTMYDHFPAQLSHETEVECRRLWLEENLITVCGCRPSIGTSVARRTKERIKRREERVKRMLDVSSSPRLQCASGMVTTVDFTTYRSHGQPTPSPPSTPSLTDLQSKKSIESDLLSEEEDVYLSCSDTEEEEKQETERKEQDEDEDVFYTPPSSPKNRPNLHSVSCDTNNNAEQMRDVHAMTKDRVAEERDTAVEDMRACPPVFIAGHVPTKQDFDVWTVLEDVEIDEAQYPLVHAWKGAMRAHIGSQHTAKDGSKDACIS
uniref:ANKLE2 third alpha/beta domain-containing protein n=1 Tax=Anopheles atroparvus TaxID=41427 RepID=A0AAG5DL23_ANOAO